MEGSNSCGGRGGGKTSNSVSRRQIQRNRSLPTVASASAWQLPRTNTRRSARIAR